MQAMSERDDSYLLHGTVQVDDAYLGGERTGGKVGRGCENKVPFVAAVSLDEKNHPCFVKFTPVPGFTLKALATWAKDNLAAGCLVLSDGLPGFRALTTAGCQYPVLVSGGKKPKDLPEFKWVHGVG